MSYFLRINIKQLRWLINRIIINTNTSRSIRSFNQKRTHILHIIYNSSQIKHGTHNSKKLEWINSPTTYFAHSSTEMQNRAMTIVPIDNHYIKNQEQNQQSGSLGPATCLEKQYSSSNSAKHLSIVIWKAIISIQHHKSYNDKEHTIQEWRNCPFQKWIEANKTA